MFKPNNKDRKVTIAEVNRDIKATFEKVFAENYQSARQQLLDGGTPEDKVEEKLSKIKAELEPEMIIKGRELLEKSILKVLEEERQEKIVSNNVSVQTLDDNASLEQHNAALK